MMIPEQSCWRSPPSHEGLEMHSQLVLLHFRIVASRRDDGATAVEYGLMVGLIAVVMIVAVTILGTQVSKIFQGVGTVL